MKHLARPIVLAAALALSGCGSAAYQAKFDAPIVRAGAPMPEVLDRSHFSKDANAWIGESDLQKVLSTPIDLHFPARVGVVPLGKPFDSKDGASLSVRATAAEELARNLAGSDVFTHVSDVSTDIPNQGGIEGLRALAARYRLRYLVLYTERFEDETHLNGWAWLYPTIIGMFAAPGVTLKSRGVLQADLLDVRTGTILYTVLQPLSISAEQWMIGAGRVHKDLKVKVAKEGAKLLAKHVIGQAHELLAYAEGKHKADRDAKIRILPPPVITQPLVETGPVPIAPVAAPHK